MMENSDIFSVEGAQLLFSAHVESIVMLNVFMKIVYEHVFFDMLFTRIC